MSRGTERESDARQRLPSEPEAREEEVIRLREAAEGDAHTIEALRGAHDQDAATIHQLEEEAVGSDRIERAQRALIAELGAEVGVPVMVKETAAEDLGGGALVREARDRRAKRQQRIVQQDELAVGGQAAVRLEPVERLGERSA